MNRRRIMIAALVCAMVVGAGIAFAGKPVGGDGYKGNGAPSGSHYNLNIVGVPKDKTADMKNGKGHVIFVKLDGKTKINLQEGDFAVLDKNGTDSDGALFQLPNPDPDYDGMTEYSVWARALGKAGKSATITTYATADGEEVSSIESVTVTAAHGKRAFSDVSKYLLYIYVDITDDDTDNPKRYPLFDSRIEDYFWEYDNSGLKLLQLRFYEIPSGPYDDIADPPA